MRSIKLSDLPYLFIYLLTYLLTYLMALALASRTPGALALACIGLENAGFMLGLRTREN